MLINMVGPNGLEFVYNVNPSVVISVYIYYISILASLFDIILIFLKVV